MHINEFKSIVSTFADPASEILFEGSRVVVSVNGDLIEATIGTTSGDVFVDEGSGPQPASKWIVHRLAKLPLLASRLQEGLGKGDIFITPAATLYPSLEMHPDEVPVQTQDALSTTLRSLSERSPLETTVLYITSDAGEGKTWLINALARKQAHEFANNNSDWLIVPIPLGGKQFLRFDDITVAALQNRYRFPFLYYNSFLALVKMGVIIPAFDGFEEMLVENSSGEALSAMGLLVGALDSMGAMLVAARKAYFEFEDLKTQEKLFDSIQTYSVGFAKLELKRWEKPQFLGYCEKRKILNATQIYARVSERLHPTHSLLTRAVLVRRLVDIAIESESLDTFLAQIQSSGPDFFSVFVRGIIEREAIEKWIDRSGQDGVGAPLLTVEEHCQLLSLIALATWENRVEFLKRDHLEFVSDYYSEATRKTAFQAQQIRERIRGHALLVPSTSSSQAVEFDHEEFRLFFLGEGLAAQLRPLNDRAKSDVLATLRKGVLPRDAQRAFYRAVKRDPILARLEAAKCLLQIASLDGQASYTQENCSGLILRLLSDLDACGLVIAGLAFATDAIRDRKLTNVAFKACYFSATSLELTQLKECTFKECKFGQLRFYTSTVLNNVTFDSCQVDSVRIMDRDVEIWEPSAVRNQLTLLGVRSPAAREESGSTALEIEFDAELRDLEKLLRYFMRSTHMSEHVMKIKLGSRANCFIRDTLPKLCETNVFAEIESRGDVQRRFKLGMQLHEIHDALAVSGGVFSEFLKACSRAK